MLTPSTHVPDPHVFWQEVLRLGRPGAPILIMDLFRLDSPVRAREIVEAAAADADPILKQDFYNSLLATFTPARIIHENNPGSPKIG